MMWREGIIECLSYDEGGNKYFVKTKFTGQYL
jgi:hypothetical protein